ncbi:MAG: hypothetical protein HFH59_00350 [Lachnospiraceae bacterium]|nr:hypothetical protein [Lachnospiraceae bacterium]MCI9356003.1 hypothetical protein [Lachnospiraceae bacterium]
MIYCNQKELYSLSYHPHIHVLCTGGGLDAGRNWHQKKGGFFLPGKSMAALFKGKFLAGLKALHGAGKLSYEGEAARYRNHYEYQYCWISVMGRTGSRISGSLLQDGNSDAFSWALHTPDSDQQQPYPAHGRKHSNHKGKGLQKRRTVERIDPGWRGVRPAFSDAWVPKRSSACPQSNWIRGQKDCPLIQPTSGSFLSN